MKTVGITKSVSTTLNSVGGTGVIVLQAVGGPYMWNVQWSSAIKLISQGTQRLMRLCIMTNTHISTLPVARHFKSFQLIERSNLCFLIRERLKKHNRNRVKQKNSVSEIGCEPETRESTPCVHACFLIKELFQRDEHILWNSSCLDSLLFSFHSDVSSAVAHDPAWPATVNSLYQKNYVSCCIC